MKVSSTNLSFKDIPHEMQKMKNNIKDKILSKVYSNFYYQYFSIKQENDFDQIKSFLTNYLIEYKFITYKICNNSLVNKILSINNISSEPDSTFVTAIICVENNCIIINSIKSDLIYQILKDNQSSKINISMDTENTPKTSEDTVAFDEVMNFCDNFKMQIKNNEFLELTIHPIISYLIRRYFYPFHYFKDQSFFFYEKNPNSYEWKFKKDLEKLILSENKFQFRENFPNFAKEITKQKDKSERQKTYKFKKEEFIKLRIIKSKPIVKLVIHIQSLYLFIIKIPTFNSTSGNSIQHETDFCKKYSHRCLTRFYGFVKENGNTGFVYEFMCNGHLSDFINKNREKIDNLFSFVSMNRIFQGISYIHSNSLIHRDIKPTNILVDNNYNVFISDYDSVRSFKDQNDEMTNDIGSMSYFSPEQYTGKKLDYATDIYPFGLLVYFLFAKKELKKLNDLDKYFEEDYQISEIIENAPKQIQNIFHECVKFNPKERMTKEGILNNMIEQMNSFEYLDNFILNENEQKKMFPLIIQYFFENINLLYQNSNALKISIQTYYIYLFLKTYINDSNSKSIIKLGRLYVNGRSFEKNYTKAKQYFEIALQKNNYLALIELGNLYENGKGVEQNYLEALKLYKLAVSKNVYKSYFLIGKCYCFGNGVKQSIDKCNEYLDLAVKSKDSKAILSIASFYYYEEEVRDYKKAKKYFEISANLNNPGAMYSLGDLYYFGNGVNQDYYKAKYYYILSIKKGNYTGYANLANLYRNGHGVKKNIYKARYYLELAAQQYDRTALIDLSEYWLHGLGSKINIEKMKECLELAISQDYDIGYLYYAYYYYNNKEYEKSIPYLEICDERNISSAQFLLGGLYMEGNYIPQDYAKAKYYFGRSAEKISFSYIILGELYFYGRGVKKDYITAKQFFEIAAKKNEPIGDVYIGHYYYEGLISKKDYEQAYYYYSKAAKCDNSYGFLSLAKLYYTGNGVEKNMKIAFDYLKKSAAKENWIALQNLGIIYYDGKYVPRNERLAKEYLESSIKSNDSDALLSLGILYYENKIIPHDYSKAIKYFKLSADLNNSFADLNLAKCYMDGRYEKPDHYKAIKFLKKAAQKNNPYAFLCLGDFYLEGKEVDQNYETAINYYKKAAEQNNSDAYLNLGLLYYHGKGVEKNYISAKEYFELSASCNNSEALYKLGKLYFDGKYIEKNYKTALEYFILSAENDNLDSYYYAGFIYENGKGVGIDISKAIQYYRKCKEIHDIDSIYVMRDVNIYTYKYIINYNYYRSVNDLGLIYAIEPEYQNIELATEFIKEAGLNEYPLGQNNLGLFYIFYLNQINNAEYFFEKAAKHKLFFAEFNLGYMKENEKKYKDMINHYLIASKYENEPFRYMNQTIDDDERLFISRSFIAFITNLKITKFYLSKNERENAENYLMQAIFQPLFRLLFQPNSKSYSFHFTFDKHTKILSNIKDFFFNCPLFNYTDLNELHSSWNEIKTNSNLIFKLIELSYENLKDNKDNKIVKLRLKQDKFEDNTNLITNNSPIKNNLNFDNKIISILNKMNSDEKFEITVNKDGINMNEIKIKFIDEELERSFKYPKKLYEILFMNLNNIKQEINEVITEGMKILYTPPYNILFGRIKIREIKKQTHKNINDDFYDGFNIDN